MAQWIGSDSDHPAPKNRFTYFRKVVELDDIPEDATLRFAADSNARLWINGMIVRRKVARYHEPRITAETVNAGPLLRVGDNVILVLHHNWGDITTFQRTANERAGLFIGSAWVQSDANWRCMTAPEFMPHEKQTVGVIGHARIRYPQIVDGRKAFPDNPHDSDFDDRAWTHAVTVTDGPWPDVPHGVETPGQRESRHAPMGVVAAGRIEPDGQRSDDPHSISKGILTAKYHPDATLTADAANLTAGHSLVLEGQAGETLYVTFDFYRPVHGYPFLELAEAPAGTEFDFGYCEIARSVYSGDMHVALNGWINTEGVVGPGYGDRYIARSGVQAMEMPDERTARWLSLHIRFDTSGRVVIDNLGIVKSQYPIRPVGSFQCGREEIDQIVKLCRIHAEVTMTDAYVDTPGREDGQWIEDDRPRAQIAERWFGDTRLRQFLIRTHAEGMGPDGNLHPFSPSNFPAYPAHYDWSVQWAAALYDEYMWTGDVDVIRTYWEPLCRYWENALSHVGQDGLWRTRRVFADIRVGKKMQSESQSSGIVTPWIIERLHWSVEMAEAVGEGGQAREWAEVRDSMTRAFRKHHLVPSDGERPLHVGDRTDPDDPGLERGYSQAGQTVSISYGLLTHDEAFENLDYAFPPPDGSPPGGVTRWNNPTYGYRTLRALTDAGLAERAVAHLVERYAPYLPGNPRNPVPLLLQGPYGGPLPEYWTSREDLGLKEGEANPAQPSDETGSHGWQSVPLLWMHDSLLGVRVVEPGGGRLRIAPVTGGLPYVSGHTLTPKGDVWVYLDPQQSTLEIAIPSGVIADVTVPSEFIGKRIRMYSPSGDVTPVKDGTAELTGSGRYVFEAF